MTRAEHIVDLFAGAGGASTGIAWGLGEPDIAVDHNPVAVAMHLANHPTSRHFVEDVFDVDPARACEGQPVGLLWLSPDCTHFSRAKGAKGGKPRDRKIRALAWVAVRWADAVRPRVICLEVDRSEEVRAFLVKFYGTSIGSSLHAPAPTVTAGGEHIGLVTVAGQASPRELFRAQGFPDDYVIDLEYRGKRLTKTQQIALAGNSVPPHLAAAIVRANLGRDDAAVAA